MRLRQIEVFHAVYASGSVTRAAEILNVSQPSISKVLAHAENQLGFALFERIRGKVVPTPEADQLFELVSDVNESVDRLRQAAAQLKIIDSGTLRVATTPAFGIDFLPWSMAAFKKEYPDVMFSLQTLPHEELAGALLEGLIDLAMAFDPENMPGIEGELLGYGRFVVLTPPGLGLPAGEPLGIADLESLPFIGLDNKSALDRLLITHLESSGVELDSQTVVGSYRIAKAMVAHGMGATITDNVTARSSGHDQCVVHDLKPELRFRIAAMHLDGAPMSLLSRKFVGHLKSSLHQFLYG